MGVKIDPKLKEILLPHQHSPRAPATWAQGVKHGTLWSTKPDWPTGPGTQVAALGPRWLQGGAGDCRQVTGDTGGCRQVTGGTGGCR